MSGIVSESGWQERCPVGEAWEPIRGPIGPGTVYLYSETTSPLPAAAMYGYWQWFADPGELAGYLTHVGFPGMLSTWFCQSQWDPNHDRVPMASRQILAGAREYGWLEDDIPFVEGLLDRLEATDGEHPARILEAVADVTTEFTDRFGRTRTWDLALKVAPTATAAGQMIAERLGWDDEYGPAGLPEPFDLDQWLGLCRAADTGDPASAAQVAEVLANNDTL